MEGTQVSDAWMIKLNVGHKYATKYYSVLKRKEILTLVTTCMNLEDIVQSEISQSQKDKYFMISLKWEFRIENSEKFLIRNWEFTQIQRERKKVEWWLPKVEGRGEQGISV